MGNFPQNLNNLRKSRGLTLQELSDRLNKNYDLKFSKASIDRWEKGISSPSIDHASAIADFFDLSLDELSGVADIKDSKPKTLAAHLERLDYTQDEIDQIIKIAEIVRNKNKN